jgi:DNA-binding transcriptional ArsR family regulator
LSARDVFTAIADPTRREILELLRDRGELMAGEIASNFASASRPGISRHLRVLKECGVVSAERDGQAQIYRLDPGPSADPRRLARELARMQVDSLKALRRRVEGRSAGLIITKLLNCSIDLSIP